jgi:hypothetical protein
VIGVAAYGLKIHKKLKIKKIKKKKEEEEEEERRKI